MDQILVELLLLDELQAIGLAILLIIAGGFAGSFLFTVRIRFRRVSHLWFLACINLALSISQFGWIFLPAAADAGMLSPLVIGLFAAFPIFGMALYYGSAARSNDIKGNSSSAWLGFVPFVNLWLIFKRGGDIAVSPATQRSVTMRYIADPLLVVGALVIFAFAQGSGKLLEEIPAYQPSDSAALTSLIGNAQTLEESFAAEAAASRRDLPLRVDDITVFSDIEAQGKTLLITFDVEEEIERLNPGLKHSLTEWQCAPEMFAKDIARGGRIVLIYRGPNDRVIGEFEITQADCNI